MKSFFTLLLTVGIFGSIASVLSDGSPLGKYVRYISALVCITIIISPLSTILKGFSAISINNSRGDDTSDSSTPTELQSSAKRMTEKQIAEKIKEKFGIIPKGVCIVIDRDGKITVEIQLNEADKDKKELVDKFIESLISS